MEVRPACWSFRVTYCARKREQAPRTPGASRHSLQRCRAGKYPGRLAIGAETSLPFCGGGRRIGPVGLLLPVLETASDSSLEVCVHLIGDSVEVLARFGEAASVEFESGQVNIDPFAFDFVVGDAQGVGPGLERVFGPRRFDAVKSLGYVCRQREVGWVELERLLVEIERFVENLLLGYAVEFGRVLAKQINGRAEVMIIDRLDRIEFDGFGVVFEGLLYRPVMAVEIGQVVIHRRIFGIERQGLFPVLLGAVLIVEVAQKAAVGNVCPGVVRMALQKILVGLADRLKALANA